ncbi:MAG: Co2+/Mg2+ efflux protein ApaG [Deltaproteobacteria bacterium]|nr:Co2+/Mg2+ efflux protein ApaG [Deltaproteobacteria bacterium]
MYEVEAITNGVRVQVETKYSLEHSEGRPDEWFFLYRIRISNESEQTHQLLSRHWIITDGTGHVEEVQGPGVVGEQPTLEPGESFEYTSGCPLTTPFGTMVGTYQMIRSDGSTWDADVPCFHLTEPNAIH